VPKLEISQKIDLRKTNFFTIGPVAPGTQMCATEIKKMDYKMYWYCCSTGCPKNNF
jgi:hypothetical protein